MLLSIFKKASQPFYNSTQLFELKEIPADVYTAFIARHFKAGRRKISADAIAEILQITLGHTWYVQMVCNRLYQLNMAIDKSEVREMIQRICVEQEIVFYRYRQLLAKGQWQLLKAIAKEGEVEAITASKFIARHNLKGSASVLRSLEKLMNDEFVVQMHAKDKPYYRLNDVFLMIWMNMKY
jgi:hypothetical protein